MKKLRLSLSFLALLPLGAMAQYSLFDITSASSSQDTVCAGVPIQFNDLSYCPDGPMAFWSWAFGDGSTSTEANPTHTYNVAGTYYPSLSAHDGMNCGNIGYSKQIVVLDPPSVNGFGNGPTCNGDCNGTAQVMVSGALSPGDYNIVWDDLQTGPYAFNLCPGNYNVVVTDDFGCQQSLSTPINVPSTQVLTGFIDYILPLLGCDGDQLEISASAMGGNPFSTNYYYQWSQQNGSGDFTDPTGQTTFFNVQTGNVGEIYLDVTDDFGCTSTTTVELVQHFSSTISGTVTVDGNPCANCPIELYKWDSFDLWVADPDQPLITNPDGTYQFIVPAYHDYIIRVNPDPLIYPTTCPTYAGNTHNFVLADQISADCNLLITEDIEVITMPAATGVCTITGSVYAMAPWPGKVAEEDPIPLIDVVIEKIPPGGSLILGHDITAIDGAYSFDFMPETNGAEYVIHVDIPGVPMAQTYNITVNPGDVLFSGLDFCVTNDQAVIETITCTVTGIQRHTVEAADISIALSPNPTDGPVRLNIAGLGAEGAAAIVVTDVAGRSVFNTSTTHSSTDLDLSSLAPGVYTLQATYNGHSAKARLVVGR